MDGDPEEFDGFEWDASKSDMTYAERGIDFASAARLFDGGYLEREDTRYLYGERRFVATGEVDGVVVTVVWTHRGRRRRIISAWPASNRERREYREQRAAIERADSGSHG